MYFKKTSAQSTSARLSGAQHAHETVFMVLYFTRTYFPTCIVQPSKLRTAKSCQVYPWILKKWMRGQNHGTCEFSSYGTSRPKSCELLLQLYHVKLSANFLTTSQVLQILKCWRNYSVVCCTLWRTSDTDILR
jgi:hypothetical protein